MIKYNQSIYSIVKRGRFYYFPRKRKPIQRNYFAYKHLKTLSNKSLNSMFKRFKFIKKNYQPGIYAIFLKDDKNGRGRFKLGRCLYVGQSTNIKRRKFQHIECIKEAKNHIRKGLRRSLDNKYYCMAKDELNGNKLIFISVWEADKKEWKTLNKEQYRELLCLYEQWAMDILKPKYNVLASRKSNDWRKDGV